MNLGLTIGGYAVAAILGLLLLSANKRIGELETKLDVQVEETREAADANDSNILTIVELVEANRRLAAARKADAERSKQEIVLRDMALIVAQGVAEQERRKRLEILKSTENCDTYANLVVADVCSAIAVELRERSRAPDSH